jgi:hypothetical protein
MSLQHAGFKRNEMRQAKCRNGDVTHKFCKKPNRFAITPDRFWREVPLGKHIFTAARQESHDGLLFGLQCSA